MRDGVGVELDEWSRVIPCARFRGTPRVSASGCAQHEAQRHTVIADLRVALVLCYVALLLWRSGFGGRDALEDWWLYMLGFAVIQFLLSVSGRVHEWWEWRRAVQALRALGPAERDARLSRLWLSGARRQLDTLVRAEGDVESDGIVERFPFARGPQRAMSAVFWAAAAMSLVILLALMTKLVGTTGVLGWGLFVIAICLAVIAAWARQRLSYMESILEIGPFLVVLIHSDGTRRTIRWSDSLLLRGRPRLRRLELSAAGRPGFVALDYDRVGIDRALALVLERGGFDLSPADLEAPAD